MNRSGRQPAKRHLQRGEGSSRRPSRRAPSPSSSSSSPSPPPLRRSRQGPAPPPPPPPAVFDHDRFNSIEAEQWYNDQKHKQFICEQWAPSDLDGQLLLTDAFDVLGWREILNLPHHYYPELVKEFYANLDQSKTLLPRLSSWVRGRDILITSDILNSHLRLPGLGSTVSFNKGHCSLLNSWERDDCLQALDVCSSLNSKGQFTVYAKHMEIRHRLLAFLLRFNVEPTISGHNEIRQTDLFIIQAMVQGLHPDVPGLNLAEYIIDGILEVAKRKSHFIFLALISTLLPQFRVNIAGAQCDDSPLHLNHNVLSRSFEYVQQNGRWGNPNRHYFADPGDGPAPPGVAPPPDAPLPAEADGDPTASAAASSTAPLDSLSQQLAELRTDVRNGFQRIEFEHAEFRASLGAILQHLGIPPPSSSLPPPP